MVAGSMVALATVSFQNGFTGAPARTAQNALEVNLSQAVAETRDSAGVTSNVVFPTANVVFPTANVVSPEGTTTSRISPASMPGYGEAVARIRIPKVGVDLVIGVGTDDAALQKGPGLWTSGSTPGSPGNASVVGHRTTYGSPFRDIDELILGDIIEIEIPGRQTAVFEVRETQIVAPSEVGVTGPTSGVRLTLITCDPPGSTGRRPVVQAELVEGEFEDLAVAPTDWQFQR